MPCTCDKSSRFPRCDKNIDCSQLELFTYSFICMKDKSELNMEISRQLDYIPQCLKCGQNMIIRYSINNDGEIWLNSAILDRE